MGCGVVEMVRAGIDPFGRDCAAAVDCGDRYSLQREIRVARAPPQGVVGMVDRDSDGVPDYMQDVGLSDRDGDGIPDYMQRSGETSSSRLQAIQGGPNTTNSSYIDADEALRDARFQAHLAQQGMPVNGRYGA